MYQHFMDSRETWEDCPLRFFSNGQDDPFRIVSPVKNFVGAPAIHNHPQRLHTMTLGESKGKEGQPRDLCAHCRGPSEWQTFCTCATTFSADDASVLCMNGRSGNTIQVWILPMEVLKPRRLLAGSRGICTKPLWQMRRRCGECLE